MFSDKNIVIKENATAKFHFILKLIYFIKKKNQVVSIKEKVDPDLQKEILNSCYIIYSGKCHWVKKVLMLGTCHKEFRLV